MFKNQLKTVVLLGFLAGLLMFIGHLLAGSSGLLMGFLFALLLNFVSYWWSDKIVLKIYRAREAKSTEFKELHQIVKNLAAKAGIPKPRIFIIPTSQMNALATGRNPRQAVIAITEGLYHQLNKEELEGVIGHELAHIKNKDILISSIAATLAAIISYIAMMARWAALFSVREERQVNFLELLVLTFVTPFMAMIIQFAISRSREYLADESSAKLTRNPSGLISALKKIQESVTHSPFRQEGTTRATAHLFIHSPFRGNFFLGELFSTHPSVQKRIQKLKKLKI